MSIETRRYHVIEKVMQLSEEQLERLEDVLGEESRLEASLDRAIKQVQEGIIKPHSEVRKKYQKWL